MLKINLLPPYIHQRKLMKTAVAVVVVAIIAEIAIMIFARTGPLAENKRLTDRLTEVKGQLQQVRTVETQSRDVLAKEAGLEPKHNFITKMLEYNEAYPELYDGTARYTYAETMFLNLEATTNSLTFDAYVSNPSDVSRLMLGLSRATHLFSQTPQITGVPGWSEAEQARRRAARQAADLPSSTIIGGYPGMPGAGGFPAGDPALGGAPGGLPMMGGNGPAGAFGGGMTAPGMGGLMPGGMGGNGPGGGPMMGAAMIDGGMGGNGPGGGGRGGQGGGDLGVLGIAGAKKVPMGFNVVVSCQLRNPISRPTYGSSDSQAGQGGGGAGGYGGMMGGMMGGMGGNGPGGGMMPTMSAAGTANGPR